MVLKLLLNFLIGLELINSFFDNGLINLSIIDD